MSDFELTNPIGAEVDDADTRTTPLWLFALLNSEFGFGVDAAANEGNALCPVWFGPGSPFGTNALTAPPSAWAQTGKPIFCNPPFSMMPEFASRVQFVRRYIDLPIVMVMPGDRHEQPWFHEHVIGARPAAEIRVPRRRVKYNNQTGTPEFPTFVVAWKPWHAGATIMRPLVEKG